MKPIHSMFFLSLTITLIFSILGSSGFAVDANSPALNDTNQIINPIAVDTNVSPVSDTNQIPPSVVKPSIPTKPISPEPHQEIPGTYFSYGQEFKLLEGQTAKAGDGVYKIKLDSVEPYSNGEEVLLISVWNSEVMQKFKLKPNNNNFVSFLGIIIKSTASEGTSAKLVVSTNSTQPSIIYVKLCEEFKLQLQQQGNIVSENVNNVLMKITLTNVFQTSTCGPSSYDCPNSADYTNFTVSHPESGVSNYFVKVGESTTVGNY